MSRTDTGEKTPQGDRLDREEIAADPAARGVVYQTLATAFEHPTEELHAGLLAGQVKNGMQDALEATALDVSVPEFAPGEGYERLSARYNRLFALGSAVVTDRTDGSVDKEGPAVSLYESSHRDDATWQTINVDLARAYEHYGLSVDTEERDHHDNLGLQLEFAGYLARREALGEADAGAARRDFLDRHLTVFAESLRDSLESTDVAGVYADLATLLEQFVVADHADLADRYDGPSSTDRSEVSF
ncbi:molecular chaperone TorD family protein [Halorhabdus sp. BNX81]|uniref:molecular chaperone TorD family protein n=1 Tax=Halorhabdus sp. BNX81 TaxID=2980181 RepID=UPI0023DD64F0|nr:molecular chaperone TorD family protein [Halorhabdus sp. BNX81]WEL21423.1 Chaperone protein TorD [Halorhabdus sp. BNX81]